MEKRHVQSWERRSGGITPVLFLILIVVESASGWVNKDIGNPLRAGSASFDAGTGVWTVRADGTGLEGTADSFYYMYLPLSGDGQIVVRITSLTAASVSTKAGLMIRETLDADSKYVFIGLTPYCQIDVQYRQGKAREPRAFRDETKRAFPVWLKLVREGDIFTAYSSADGRSWISQPRPETIPLPQLGTIAVPMSKSVYLGLAVTSHSPGVPCAATVDNLVPEDSAQPDLTLRTDSEYEPSGSKVLDTDPAAISAEQTRSQVIGEGMTAIYPVQLINAGLVKESFTVYSFPCGNGWDVRYEDLATGTDVAGQLASPIGWTPPPLAPSAWAEIRLMVTPPAGAVDGDSCEFLVRAMSSRSRTKVDTIKVVTRFGRDTPRPPWGRTFTTSSDFDEGTLVNVRHEPQEDQLQLPTAGVPSSSAADVLPYIWVPNWTINQSCDSVSKVDTRTGRELGRYRTCPANVAGSPSRTTVDQEGNCWVGNRMSGTVVKIGLLESDQWEDRNGNGIADTSRDLNNDGQITGKEILPWGSDECVLLEIVLIPKAEQTYTPGKYPGPYTPEPCPRALAVDPENNIWAGCYYTRMYYQIRGTTGEILRKVDVSIDQNDAPMAHTPYGAVIDANGILWSSGHMADHILRLDPANDCKYSIIPIRHFAYGLGLHKDGYLFVSGYMDGKLSRIRLGDPNNQRTWGGMPTQAKGVVCTPDGDVWIANAAPGADALVVRCTQEGRVIKKIPVGDTPTGLAVDSQGKVWVVDDGDEYIHRIDPNTNEVELSVRLPGAYHYGYSDMTGFVTRNYTMRTGSWTIRHNTMAVDSQLGGLWWDADIPSGTSLRFFIRSSNDQQQWSPAQEMFQPCTACEVPPGRYFEVKAVFKGSNAQTPVLRELTFCFDGPAVCAQQPGAPRP
jgi:DNA-binding beta-propeller fold protein YncE